MLLNLLFHAIVARFRSRAALEAEPLALRHQLIVVRRRRQSRPRLTLIDRLIWIWLYRLWPHCLDAASLSIPWGNSRDDIGGYHLVRPRDLVESALALVSLGALEEARDSLRYLIATQLTDGRWPQNQWLGGTPCGTGVQLDEVAWPVLLAAALAERGALEGIRSIDMVRRALGFIIRTGPGSDPGNVDVNQCSDPIGR